MDNELTTLAHGRQAGPVQPGYVWDGRRQPQFPDGQEPAPSKYLRYLPAIYSADPFVGRFLRIFEDVLEPVSMMVDDQPYYFDPMTAPLDLLEWLAFWVDMDDEADDWPLPKKRALVAAAAFIYRMRGTRAGLRKHVGIYVGEPPLIMERTNGFRLHPDARLGVNTSIGENLARTFTVTLVVSDPKEIDTSVVQDIIEADKPVETSYVLRMFNRKTGELHTIRPAVLPVPK
jgi:phage tail-like protein